MNKLVAIVSASFLLFTLTLTAGAADEGGKTPEENLQSQEQKEPAAQQPTADLTEREQDYLNALNRCESMSATEKDRCVAATKKEFGHE
jgi:hypothetical protein